MAAAVAAADCASEVASAFCFGSESIAAAAVKRAWVSLKYAASAPWGVATCRMSAASKAAIAA